MANEFVMINHEVMMSYVYLYIFMQSIQMTAMSPVNCDL